MKLIEEEPAMKARSVLVAMATVLLVCGVNAKTADEAQQPNTLTEAEKKG